MLRRTAARRRGAGLLLAGGLAAAALILLAGIWWRSSHEPRLRSNEDRVTYLESLGWLVEEVPISEQTVLFPEVFPDVLVNYNTLQLQQGFDLQKYAGKEAQLYIYRVLNYPTETENEEVCCCLYICKGRVIGGDVHSSSFTGFIQGLR